MSIPLENKQYYIYLLVFLVMLITILTIVIIFLYKTKKTETVIEYVKPNVTIPEVQNVIESEGEISHTLDRINNSVIDVKGLRSVQLEKQNDGINYMYPKDNNYIKIENSPWKIAPRYRPKIWKYFLEYKKKIKALTENVTVEPATEMINQNRELHPDDPGFCSCIFSYKILPDSIEYSWGIYYISMPGIPLDFKLSTGIICDGKERNGVILDSWGDIVKINMKREKGWTRISVLNNALNESKEPTYKTSRMIGSPYLVRAEGTNNYEYTDGMIHGKTIIKNDNSVEPLPINGSTQAEPFISGVDMFEVLCR